MPNRSRRRRPQRGQRNRDKAPTLGSISAVAFHTAGISTLSGATGNGLFPLNPQGTAMGGVADVADQFDLFRVSKLEYRIHPMDPTDTVFQTCQFVPDVDVQTITSAQAAHSPLAAVQTPFCGVPSPWIRVPRSQLKGMLDWYKCTADAGAAEFESQGTIILTGGLSDNLSYEFRGVVLFKNPVSSAVQMERLIQRAVNSGKVVRLPPPSLPTAPAAKAVTPRHGQCKDL